MWNLGPGYWFLWESCEIRFQNLPTIMAQFLQKYTWKPLQFFPHWNNVEKNGTLSLYASKIYLQLWHNFFDTAYIMTFRCTHGSSWPCGLGTAFHVEVVGPVLAPAYSPIFDCDNLGWITVPFFIFVSSIRSSVYLHAFVQDAWSHFLLNCTYITYSI